MTHFGDNLWINSKTNPPKYGRIDKEYINETSRIRTSTVKVLHGVTWKGKNTIAKVSFSGRNALSLAHAYLYTHGFYPVEHINEVTRDILRDLGQKRHISYKRRY
jgi:hypothetical protein